MIYNDQPYILSVTKSVETDSVIANAKLPSNMIAKLIFQITDYEFHTYDLSEI